MGTVLVGGSAYRSRGDFNDGRIRLLDIFAQDGKSYQLRSTIGAGDGKPFRRRPLTRIGSMLTLGDNKVEDWPEQCEELSNQLLALEEDEGYFDRKFFKKGFEPGSDRKYVVGADSKILASVFGFVKGNFGSSATLEVLIRSPVYERVAEDALDDFIDGASWKPDLRKIAKVKRKGVSFWGTDEKLELWIVTELKLGIINYTSRKERDVGANVRIPAADLATPVPVAAGVNASSSEVRSRQVQASANREESLYGFKAVRVTFDKNGNYVSRRGDMGKTKPHVTRAEKKRDLEPDEDPDYHMSTFFVGAGSADEDQSGEFECVELDFQIDDIPEDDISPLMS